MEMKSNYLSFCEYLTKIPLPDFSSRMDEQNDQVQLPVILRIFDENQNPVDMHTSIMCINILQNIKAVALKL